MPYKPGYKTTEMYMTALAYIAFFATLYMVGTGMITEELGKWVLTTLAGGSALLTREYTRSRGLLKATSNGEG